MYTGLNFMKWKPNDTRYTGRQHHISQPNDSGRSSGQFPVRTVLMTLFWNIDQHSVEYFLETRSRVEIAATCCEMN